MHGTTIAPTTNTTNTHTANTVLSVYITDNTSSAIDANTAITNDSINAFFLFFFISYLLMQPTLER